MWEAVIRRNPFREAAESDPAHLVVIFLKGADEEGSAQIEPLFSLDLQEALQADARSRF